MAKDVSTKFHLNKVRILNGVYYTQIFYYLFKNATS